MLKRVKVLTGYAAHARFTPELGSKPIGWIPRQTDIKTPYSSGPNHPVFIWKPKGIGVIICETKHRRYEVFEVPKAMILTKEQDATDVYIISKFPKESSERQP